MKQLTHLLDSNICIRFLRGDATIVTKLNAEMCSRCALSVVTEAELLFGAMLADDPIEASERVYDFVANFECLPLAGCLHEYAVQKVRLRKIGKIIEDFDLLIGATALSQGLVLATTNIRHLARIDGLRLEDWSKGA